MAKNLDGIKKLNSEEIKKYRSIVLDYIGEKEAAGDKSSKNKNQTAAASKRVDGIKIGQVGYLRLDSRKSSQPAQTAKPADQAARLKEAVKRQEIERKRIKEEERLYLLRQQKEEKERQNSEARAWQEKIRQLAEEKEAEERAKSERREAAQLIKLQERERREKAKRAELAAKAKVLAEKEKQRQEKIRLEEEKREQEKLAEENRRLEKIRRREELKRVKQEMKLARLAAREKRRLKRQKDFKKFKNNLKLKINQTVLTLRKNIVYIILYFITLSAVIYVIICVAILRFDFNNFFVNRLIDYLPVPAVITNQGVIYYKDFQDIKDRQYSNLNYQGEKSNLAKWVVLNNLAKQFGLSPQVPEADLAQKFLEDKNFNQVSLSRIKKIRSLLSDGGQIDYLSKYADEYKQGSYFSSNDLLQKFGLAASELAVGETSDIVFGADGYYIIKIIDNQGNKIGIDYLFIKGFSLDEYLKDKSAKAKVFILAD